MGIFQNNPFFGSKTSLEEAAAAEPAAVPAEAKSEKSAEVSFDTFISVDLRVGTVLTAEPVQGSEKLLNLSVDLGEPEPRQILSGIAKYVAPDDLIGKQFTFVANLPPRQMMGMPSNGMLLATDGEDGLVLVSPAKPVKPGARLH